MASIKKLGKLFLCLLLEQQVRALRRRHPFQLVAVAGSVGKTSVKLTIARLAAADARVQYQDGNYNDRLTVPLVMFGHQSPELFDILSWWRILRANQRTIHGEYPFDVVVVELGTDHPGDLAHFAYLQPDIAIVTSVTPEHMEYFDTLDAVAREELSVMAYAKQLVLGVDDIAPTYTKTLKNYKTYGLNKQTDTYGSVIQDNGLQGQLATLEVGGKTYKAQVPYPGASGLKTVLASLSVAAMLGLDMAKVVQAVPHLPARPGRMQILGGLYGSLLIDDTYNASPLAVKAALDVLYGAPARQRIAILGSMNELGASSEAAHREVGEYCDATKLALVITIGKDSERYLAPAARARGCVVEACSSPYIAGQLVHAMLDDQTIVLAKGSQNGVFAEEALKLLLADPTDASKLVRQSDYWLRVKRQQFGDPTPYEPTGPSVLA